MKNLNSYKKIAKEFIKEAAWDRKFGEPLPTLEDVMKENTVKFKDKDGKDHEIDMDTAKQYKKDVDGGDSSDYKKIAVKAAGLDKDDKDSGEKDSGGKLGGSDFSRDGGDKGDVPVGKLPDPSSRQGDPEANKAYQAKKAAKAKAAEKPKAEPKAKNKFGVSDDQYLGQTDGPGHRDVTVKQALAYDGDNSTMKFYKRKAQGLIDDGDFEAYGIDPNHPKGGSPNAKAAEPKDEPKGELPPKIQNAVGELEDLQDPDEIEGWIEDHQRKLMGGKIGRGGSLEVDKFVKAFRDMEDSYGDDEEYDEKLQNFKGMVDKTMDRYRKKSESIKVIDGKKYKAIKESKKNPRILKEIYDRTFRSLK